MKRKIFGLFLTVSMAMGCADIRLKYEGKAQTPDGKKSNVVFEKSYVVGGGVKEFCAITGILLGGACWYYFVMPTSLQSKEIENDATDYVRKTTKNNSVVLERTNIDRIGWYNITESGTITAVEN